MQSQDAMLRHGDKTEDFVSATAAIKGVTIKPLKGATGILFQNSNVSAASIGWVNLANVQFNNNQAGLNETQDNFGVWSRTIRGVKYASTTDKTRNWVWAAGRTLPLSQTLVDLNISPLV